MDLSFVFLSFLFIIGSASLSVSTSLYQDVRLSLMSSNYTNVLFQRSFDVPYYNVVYPDINGCRWNGAAFGYGNDATGAFVSDGSCMMKLNPREVVDPSIDLALLPHYPELSVQMQIAIDSVPTESSVLFSVGQYDSLKDAGVEIGLAGRGKSDNSFDASQETALQVRVFNQGKSCADLGAGCPLDLPGFFQIGVWMDLLVSFSPSGFTSVYLNGSLVKSDYLFKRGVASKVGPVFLGASIASAEIMSGDGKKPSTLPDNASFRIRSLTLLNTTYSPYNISDFYSSNIGIMPAPTVHAQYDIQPDGSVTGSIIKEAKFNFYTSPTNRQFDFTNPKVFDIDPITNTAEVVAFGSVQSNVRGALGAVTFDAVVLKTNASYLRIPPLLVTSQASFQVIFKMNPHHPQSRVIFACSDQVNDGRSRPQSTSSGDSIYLIASPRYLTTSNIVNQPAYTITLFLQRGRRSWFNFSALTDSVPRSTNAQRMAMNVLNILVTIEDSSIQIFNHGILIGKYLNPPTPYPRWRHYCTLGGIGQNLPEPILAATSYANKPIMNDIDASSIAYNFFGYWPSVVSADSIGGVQVTNSSIPISPSWENRIFDFYAKPDLIDSTYMGRDGAEWSSTVHSFSVFLNGTSRVQPGWILQNGGYLNLGSVAFGNDFSLLIVLSILELKEGATICQFTNGPIYPGSDEFFIGIGSIDSISGDLVINVKNSGVESPNGPIRLLGVLRSFLTQSLIIVFRQNKINVYIDGVPLLLNGLLWSPVAVRRPFALVGRSLELTNTLPLMLFTLKIDNKVWTSSDITASFPYNTTGYKFSFLSESHPYNEGVSYYPLLRNCSFSTNPFNLPYTQYDGTLQGGYFKSPTPGVYLDNKSPDQISFEYRSFVSRWNTYQDLSKERTVMKHKKKKIEAEAERHQMKLFTVNQLIKALNTTITTTTTPSPTPNTTALVNGGSGDDTGSNGVNRLGLQDLIVQKAQIQEMRFKLTLSLERLEQDIAFLDRRINAESGLLNITVDDNGNDDDDGGDDNVLLLTPSVEEFMGKRSNSTSFIEMGPTLIGGQCSIRTKIRVESVIDSSKWMPVWELSNGPSNDTLALFISGNTTNQILQLVVYRGARAKSVQSAAMDGSVYWLDIVITISDTTVKFYNWGVFISSATGLWTPSRIIRSRGMIGRSLSPSAYLVDSAISLVTFSNQLMDPVYISGLYLSDHPAITEQTVAQLWQVNTPVTQNDQTHVRYMWLMDLQMKQNLVLFDEFRTECSDFYIFRLRSPMLLRWLENPCNNWLEQVYIFHIRALEDDGTAARKNYLNPLFKTRKGHPDDYTAQMDKDLPRGATSRLTLFDDGPVANGGFITGIEYFEPLLLYLPMEPDLGEHTIFNNPPINSEYRMTWNSDSDSDSLYSFTYRRFYQTWNDLLATMGTQFNFDPLIKADATNIANGRIGLLPLDQVNVSSASIANLATLFNLGLVQQPSHMKDMVDRGPTIGGVDYCYHVGLCSARAAALPPPHPCVCNQDNYNIIILPPAIRLLYGGVGMSEESQRQRMAQPINADGTADNKKIVNRFYLAALDPKNAAAQPKNISLSVGESIIRVNTKCNFRFEFITSLGRSIVVGDHPIMDQITDCPPSSFYSQFLGSEFSANQNVEKSAEEAAKLFGANGAKKSSTIQSWGKPGYSLHHMEGSLAGMYAYRFHWIRKPVSYRMKNVQFDSSASDLVLSDVQPEYTVSVDLYNNGPIQQSITAIHSITKTKEQSFSNTNTEEHQWEKGVSFSIEMSESVTEEIPEIASVTATIGASIGTQSNFGMSQSVSTTYGTSISTSEELQQWFTAEVPPKSKITATLIAYQSKRMMPYKADVEIQYASGEKDLLSIQGIYKEVNTDSLIVKYSDALSLND